jgi:hypothetical protein
MTDVARLHPDERRAIVNDLLAALMEQVGALPSMAQHPQRTESFDATASDIAQRLGLSADWVREHADALGGVRVGTGARPRHRFNIAVADERIAAMRSGAQQVAPKRPEPERKRRRRKHAQSNVPLLPIKGKKAT